MKAKANLHKLLSMLLALVMVVGMLPATALAEGATPATKTADFDTDAVASLALLNNYKTGTEDSTWDASTKTLTLNGVNFVTTDFTAMKLPAGAKIVLNGKNTITGGDSGLSCYGIYVSGFMYIEGSGKLTVTAGNSTGGISCGIKATGVVVNGGDITAKGGTAKTDSYGISNSYSMVIEEGGKVTAIAGTVAGNSIGAMNATMRGGTLIASGDNQALENAPEFDNYSVYWWRTSSSGTYKNSSTAPYTYASTDKYIEFRDTEPCDYTVSFNANGGTGTMKNVITDYGLYSLPANGFIAPDGKYFKGWALSPDGSVIFHAIYSIKEDTTFYAIWGDITYIDSVDVTIIEPVAGANPQDAVSNTENVIVIDTEWYGYNDATYTKLSASDTFEAGKTYIVDVDLMIGGVEYQFTDNTTITINGSNTGEALIDTNEILIEKKFTDTGAPTGVTVTSTSSSLTLSWDKVDSATGYFIQQYKNGAWTHVRQLARNTVTTYTATNLTPSTTYQYRIRAYYTDGSTTTYSEYTTVSGTTNPSNISGVKAASTANSVTISWDKNSSATGYFVQQYKNGAWTHVRQLARNTATTFTASGLNPSTKYQYRIRAYYTDGSTTTYSDYKYVSPTTKPSNMTGVKATSTANTVTLSWDKNDSATGYFIQQYKNGTWTHIRQLARNTVLSYTATGLTPSTTYQYRIRAYYTNGTSTTYSDYKYVSPTTKPSNMTGVKATSTANTVTLSWDKNDTATGYFIQQYKNGEWTHIRQLARNTVLSYTATGLTPSTNYQFRIRAYYTNGSTTTYSDYKTVSCKTTS